MSTSASPVFGPSLDQLGITALTPTGDYLASAGLTDTSTFDPTSELVDPTNTGDTGALQDTSTPLLPSVNNPETAASQGNSNTQLINTSINALFSAWQLSSQPKGTPKTVTTQVGATKVVSGAAPSVLSSIFGGASTGATSQSSNLLLIGILLIVGLLLYKKFG